MMDDENRRFKLLKAGTLPNPGTCITCGSTDRDCIWFGAVNYVHFPGTDGSRDRFGSVLICRLCFASAITENPGLGFITFESHEAALAKASEDISRLERAENAVEQLSEDLGVVISNFRDRLVDDYPDIAAISSVESKGSSTNPGKSDTKAGLAQGWDWGAKEE